ncbi:MAG TPA: class I SAM-dependent methyltransferase [Sphingomicrobium sp.]|jgi:SAM-dependent methyltransferase
MKTCRLCGRTDISVVLAMPRLPRNIQRLFTPDTLHEDRPTALNVYRCNSCRFVQLLDVLEDDYYDDYLMTTSHSRQMQDYQRDQARDFVIRFGLEGRHIKEMGCGDGSYLDHLAAAGAVTSGIEPSKRFRALAVEKGHAVEEGYVTATRRLDDGPFDGFVTRQVLEHVPDVNDFLTGIRRNMKPGAFGLIEVPSLEKALADRRFYDFFPDHLNYFSLHTLDLACRFNGFRVIDTFFGMYGEYNIALVTNDAEDDFVAVQSCVTNLSADIRAFIARNRAEGRRVAIWGSGAKGLSVLAAAGVTDVDILVDGDPHKRGLITPISHLEVRDPEALRDYADAAILITAMAYRHEIERTLLEDFGFRGELAVLAERLETVRKADLHHG